jgi:hypothetical protein
MENMELNQIDPNEVLAKLVKREDGYHVIDHDGTEGPICNRMTADGYIILTPNASNRKCVNKKNADAYFAEHPDGCIELTYKATRTIANSGPKMPNAKLISYLSEEEQEEYKAIIARAIAAKDADKKKPMTELEKAQAAFERAQAKLAKLMEDAEGGNI